MSTRIKLLALDGASPAEVIRLALDMNLTEFAREHGFSKQEVSQCINGHRLQAKVRDALAAELEVERKDIDELLSRHESAGG